MSGESNLSNPSTSHSHGRLPHGPIWSIVRHYNVLFSSDKDKKDTNRVWHDGRLNHHTYNGRLVLFDEADIEVANGFHSQQDASTVFTDGLEVTIDDFVVQVQRFERVSRTDVAPVLNAKRAAKEKRNEEIRRGVNPFSPTSRTPSTSRLLEATDTTARSRPTPSARPPLATSPTGRFLTSSSSSEDDSIRTPRRPPTSSTIVNTPTAISPPAQPAFRTPFKRPRLTDEQTCDSTDESEAEPRRKVVAVKKRLGPMRPRPISPSKSASVGRDGGPDGNKKS